MVVERTRAFGSKSYFGASVWITDQISHKDELLRNFAMHSLADILYRS